MANLLSETIIISSDNQDTRLDVFLTDHFKKEFSRSFWQKHIKLSHVLINKEPTSVHSFLQEGNIVTISIPKEPKKEIKKAPQIPILFENENFLIINKPAGITVHKPFLAFDEPTVIDEILKTHPEIKKVGDNPLRPGIVHRLDKPVSGIMVIAKNQVFFDYLKKQFQNRSVTKKYIALVYGVIPKEEGIIDLPLDTSTYMTKVKQKGSINDNVKEAITHFLVTKRFKTFTLLDIMIETGKTHQIRAHLSYYGYPIVGETMYIPKHFKRKKLTDRLFLHASFISFFDQERNEHSFHLDLPSSLQELLTTLP